MAIVWEPVEYNGIRIPFKSRTYGFTQRLARHQFAFRDLSDIEMLGASNPRWNYTIPLSDGIRLKEWGDSNLLTLTLPRFMRACFLSEPGDLVDPLYGNQRVVPVSYSEKLETAARNHVDVQVEFSLYPTKPELPITGQKLASLAVMYGSTQQLDANITATSLPPESIPEGGFSNPLQLAQTYLSYGEAYAAYYTAQIDAYVGQLDQLAQTIEQASDPIAWQLKPLVDKLRANAQRIARTAGNAAQNVLKHTVQHDTTLPGLAMLLDLDPDALLLLNPGISAAGFIPSGAIVKLS